jgi:hypothetical protein
MAITLLGERMRNFFIISAEFRTSWTWCVESNPECYYYADYLCPGRQLEQWVRPNGYDEHNLNVTISRLRVRYYYPMRGETLGKFKFQRALGWRLLKLRSMVRVPSNSSRLFSIVNEATRRTRKLAREFTTDVCDFGPHRSHWSMWTLFETFWHWMTVEYNGDKLDPLEQNGIQEVHASACAWLTSLSSLASHLMCCTMR